MSYGDFEQRIAQLEQQVATFRPSEAMVMAPKGQVVTPGGVVTTQGPYLPTIGADNAANGQVAWTNPGAITADDGLSADVLLANAANTSHFLVGTAFGFNLPGGSIIQGIQLDIKCQTQGGTDPGAGTAFSAQLVKGGVVGSGSSLASGLQLPTAALTYITCGGPSSLWGLTWTAADINAANFGASFQTKASPPLVAGHTCDPLVDAMRITISYISP